MKKKLIALALTSAMVMGMGTTAMAATGTTSLNDQSTTDNITVEGTYINDTVPTATFSVDISWDDMSFTYTDHPVTRWNPETHRYEFNNTDKGTWSKSTAAIRVNNHSNAQIQVGLEYAAIDTGVIGSFSESSKTMNNCGLGEEAPYWSSTFGISGAPTNQSKNFEMGTITVHLAPVDNAALTPVQ